MSISHSSQPTRSRYPSPPRSARSESLATFDYRTYGAAKLRRLALTTLGLVVLLATALATRSRLETVLATRSTDEFHPLPGAVRPQSERAYSQHLLQQLRTHHRVVAATSRISTEPAYQFATPDQELGVLISFLAAFASSSLPVSVDASKPLDPDLVLEFNPREANAAEDVRVLVKSAWARNPVVVFSDLHSGHPAASREMKGIFEELKLYPRPTVFEVDQRDDEAVLRPLLQRLTAAEALPLAIIGGKPVRSLDELRKLSASGALKEMVTAAGAKVAGRKSKHGRKH